MNLQSIVRGPAPGLVCEHRWRAGMHMDGCHWYRSTWTCARCGAGYQTYDERDPTDDPYALIWMNLEYDKERDKVECDRCAGLLDGENAVHVSEYVPGRHG